MKIIQFLHGDQIAGMEKFCLDLTNELSKEHQVMFLGDRALEKYLDQNVIFVELDSKKSRNNIVYMYKILKIFKDFSPEIIHVHRQKSIQIMKRLKIFLNIPFIATKHDMQKKKAFYGLDYAISISDETKDTIEAKKVFKIYNGIPYLEPKKIEMPNVFNIVAVGGLRKVKGYDALIEAVSKLSFPFHLTIIGEGDERPYLEESISNLGLDEKISLIGFKSNINDYLYSADLQVISSKSEGFSLAMIEGIFYSKILISTRVSGCTEILSDDLMYEIKQLTKKINDVYENKNRYQNSFSKVKETYKPHLTIEACAKEHLNVYAQTYEIFKELE